jgi:hypothetical protein
MEINCKHSIWLRWRCDLAAGLALLLGGLCVSMWLSSHWPIELNDSTKKPFNVWFYSDATVVYENMTLSASDHYRTNRHPLFSVMTNPLVTDMVLIGMSPWMAVRLIVAAAGGSLLALTYAVLRLIMTRRLDAVLGTTLLASTSSFAFWAGVPETFVFGSTTIVGALAFAAYQRHQKTSTSSFVYITVFAMSVTITNVSVALAILWRHQSIKQGFRIAATAFLVVLTLWSLQKYLYPSAGFFLGNRDVLGYVLMDEAGTVWERLCAMFVHSVVMPSISINPNPWNQHWPLMSIEHSVIDVGSPVRFVAISGWAAFLVSGLIEIARTVRVDSFSKVLIVSIAFQVVLHLLFGDEAFLYSLHWTPMLVILVTLSLRASRRLGLRFALLAIVICNCVVNYSAFIDAANQAPRLGT